MTASPLRQPALLPPARSYLVTGFLGYYDNPFQEMLHITPSFEGCTR